MFTQREIREILEDEGLRPQHAKGQNFMIDLNLLDAIVRLAEVEQGDLILEFGTGLGSLTGLLAEKADHVFTVEIDQRIQKIARHLHRDRDNITYFLGDALANKNNLNRDWIDALTPMVNGFKRLKVVANLPYNIASPLIALLLKEDSLPIESMMVVIQKEVAQRLVAEPGTKAYGRLTVICQSQSKVTIHKTIPPNVFWPPPKVSSAVVELRPSEKLTGEDRNILEQLLASTFNHRRKKVSKTLTSGMGEEKALVKELLTEVGIGHQQRPEEIGVSQFIELSRRWQEKFSP